MVEKGATEVVGAEVETEVAMVEIEMGVVMVETEGVATDIEVVTEEATEVTEEAMEAIEETMEKTEAGSGGMKETREAKWEEETTTEMISATDRTDDCCENSFVSDTIHSGIVRVCLLLSSWVVKLTFVFLFGWEDWGQFPFRNVH
ncbi:hypothetical protein STEG23_006634 [Scotinomys teguina]